MGRHFGYSKITNKNLAIHDSEVHILVLQPHVQPRQERGLPGLGPDLLLLLLLLLLLTGVGGDQGLDQPWRVAVQCSAVQCSAV